MKGNVIMSTNRKIALFAAVALGMSAWTLQTYAEQPLVQNSIAPDDLEMPAGDVWISHHRRFDMPQEANSSPSITERDAEMPMGDTWPSPENRIYNRRGALAPNVEGATTSE